MSCVVGLSLSVFVKDILPRACVVVEAGKVVQEHATTFHVPVKINTKINVVITSKLLPHYAVHVLIPILCA